jgi:hypothetical protein
MVWENTGLPCGGVTQNLARTVALYNSIDMHVRVLARIVQDFIQDMLNKFLFILHVECMFNLHDIHITCVLSRQHWVLNL